MPGILFFGSVAFASLIVVLFASDLAVSGISHYARKLGISDFLVGFIVVGIGTSLPELISSATGASAGEGGIVLGTLFGSLIGSYCLVLGIPAILQKKIKVSKQIKERRNWPILLIISFPALLALDGTMSRIDGFIFLSIYFIYIYILWMKEGTLGQLKKDVKIGILWKDAVIFLGALIALLLSARWLVYSILRISKDILGIDPFTLAITVIGIASTIPDLLVEIRSIYQGHAQIGMGNVLGSGIMNMTVILGLVTILSPFTVNIAIAIPALILSLCVVSFVLYVIHQGEFKRIHGIILAIVYVTFIAAQFLIK
jgi:cation:H+ antiporter